MSTALSLSSERGGADGPELASNSKETANVLGRRRDTQANANTDSTPDIHSRVTNSSGKGAGNNGGAGFWGCSSEAEAIGARIRKSTGCRTETADVVVPKGDDFQQVPLRPSKIWEEKWEKMFKRLLDYKAKHGNTLVPNRYSDDPPLGLWVSTQRRQYNVLITGSYKSAPITPERARRLEDIGFVWETGDPRSVSWDVQFKELLAFKEKNGHVLVPVRYEDKTKLGIWVTTQRRERKRFLAGQKSKILTEERIQRLNEVGFVWKTKRGGKRGRSRKRTKRAMVEESRNSAESTRSRNSRKRPLSSDRSKTKEEPARKTKQWSPQMSDTSAPDLNKPAAELDDKNEPSRTSLQTALPVQQQQPLVDETTALLGMPFRSSPLLDGVTSRREGLVPSTTPLIESQFHSSDHHTRMRILRAEEELQTRLNRRLQIRQQALLVGGASSVPFRNGEKLPFHVDPGGRSSVEVSQICGVEGSFMRPDTEDNAGISQRGLDASYLNNNHIGDGPGMNHF